MTERHLTEESAARADLVAMLIGMAIVLLYALFVLLSGKVDTADFGGLWSTYLKAAAALAILLVPFALIAHLAIEQRAARGRSALSTIRDCVATRWRRDRLVSFVWPPLLFATLLTAFNAFKQMILPGAGFSYDDALIAIDRAFFFGTDPWRVTHAVFATPEATWFIDKAYHGWFVPMSIGVILCSFLPAAHARLRAQYLLSYVLVWIVIGSGFAYLLPAAGPCFYAALVGPAPLFDPLFAKLAADQAALGPDVALSALQNQAGLLRLFGGDELALGGGISAMPSVHNALAALFAFAAFRLNRTAGYCVAGYALLIWIGSIHLGWHYAIDGPIAVAMAYGIWTVAGALFDRLEVSQRASQRHLASA